MTTDKPKNLPQPLHLGNGLTPVDIWQSLHAGERRWIAQAGGEPRFVFDDQADLSDRGLMQLLTELPARRWVDLCNGAGWTGLAASALSWCRNAQLGDVFHVYRMFELVPEPGNVVERSASMINPAILPENRLSALYKAAGKPIDICVMIAARAERPLLDMEQHQINALHPCIRDLIQARQRKAPIQ